MFARPGAVPLQARGKPVWQRGDSLRPVMDLRNGPPIRILVVGEAAEAKRVRTLLRSAEQIRFQLEHAEDVGMASEILPVSAPDVLLLDLGAAGREHQQSVQEARTAAPDVAMIVLADVEDEGLALDVLKQGAQDFLAKEHLDGAALARSARFSIARNRVRKDLQDLCLVDDLTGLYNRRGFVALAGQHLRMIRRKGAALLVYLDVDDLKVTNDTFGHLEGNRALTTTAGILRACFRQSDILARLGGDEFSVLLTDAVQDSAHHVRRRLEQRVQFANLLSSHPFRLSLSVGVAEVPVGRQLSLDDLLQIADADMYRDKGSKQVRSLAGPRLRQTTAV